MAVTPLDHIDDIEDIPDKVTAHFFDAMDAVQNNLFIRAVKEFVKDGGYFFVAHDGSLYDDDSVINAIGNAYTDVPLVENDGTSGTLVLSNLVGHGRGGGSKIMQEVINIAESNNYSVVLYSLTEATGFYERFGFQHIYFLYDSENSLDMFYYPDGVPDFLKDNDEYKSLTGTDYAKNLDKARFVMMAAVDEVESYATL